MCSLENIIFIIVKQFNINKMSYMTVVPNIYFNPCNTMPSINNQYISNQLFYNNQKILSYLQSALRTSLYNYQLSYQQTSNLPQVQSVSQKSEKTAQKISQSCLELKQSHEENKEISNHIKAEIEKLPISTPKHTQEKEAVREPLLLTDDQLLLEDKEKNIKKNQISKRKGKKVKEDTISSFVVPIPQIDLIQTAYLPAFSLPSVELCRKRELLMQRKVQDWKDINKGRKDKREIRMLGN